MSAKAAPVRATGRSKRRSIARWKATALAVGCVLFLIAALVTARSLTTLREHADEAPSDGRLQQAHEDLVHAMVAGVAGATLAVGVGLGGYGVSRRAAP